MRRKKSTGYLRFFFLRVVDVRRPAGDAPRDGAPGAVAAPGAAGTGAPWPLPSAEVTVAARRRRDAAGRPSATASASIWLVLVSYTHLRAHETGRNLVCRLLLEKK